MCAYRSIGIADDLLRRLHAWLLDPTSQLHSPLLLTTIETAVAKTFLQLLAELRALDATVVAASPASVIIATRKHTLPAAAAYVSFLTDTLAARPLFAWLSLQPSRVWTTLLWRDSFNYAGVRVPLAALAPEVATAVAAATPAPKADAERQADDDMAALEDDVEGEGVADAGADAGPAQAEAAAAAAAARRPADAGVPEGCAYEAHWNLREFLPPAVHKYFDDVMERFVVRPWRAVHADGAAPPVRPRCQPRSTFPSATVAYVCGALPSSDIIEPSPESSELFHATVVPFERCELPLLL